MSKRNRGRWRDRVRKRINYFNRKLEKPCRDVFQCQVNEIFNQTGIYFLRQGKEIVYIGQSECVISRIVNHVRDTSKIFDSFSYSLCDKTETQRRQIEAFLIKRHQPKYNVKCKEEPTSGIRVTYQAMSK